MDLKDMFLRTPMHKPAYMKVLIKYFTEDINEKFNLDPLIHKGYIYIKIKKGVCGLNQVSVLSYKHLSAL